MSAIVRFVFPLIAYLCVGTVISLGAGYGYLRYSGKLGNEHMFQIVSLLHGINLEKIANTYKEGSEEVPPEESSFEQQQEKIQLAVLHRQGKRDDLKKLVSEFDSKFKSLTAAEGQNRDFKEEVETYLKQLKEKSIESGIVGVRGQMQILIAKKQAKPLLIQMIEDERMDEVILLLNGISARNRREILRTFDSEEDIQMLYKIQERMIRGDPVRSFLDSKLEELDEGKK